MDQSIDQSVTVKSRRIAQHLQEKDGVRYAAGIRMGLAMAWNSDIGKLYLVQHGRDQPSELWPYLHTPKQRSELPAG